MPDAAPDELSEPLRTALNEEPNVILLLRLDGTIAFLNREWTRTNERDGDPPSSRAEAVLGRSYLDFVMGPMRSTVAEAFERAAALESGFGSIWLHGECNTVKECRVMTTRISMLRPSGPDGQPTGFLVHHSLRIVGALGDRYTLVEPDLEAWRDAAGLILQCSCCRRVRDPATVQWVMCVELLEQSADGTSHGLCEVCLETYYAEPTPVAASGGRLG